jgi:hypothetical protein
MKINLSGNGVTVANHLKILRTICGYYWSETTILSLKASKLSPVWDYRAEGLNLDQAKQSLIAAIKTRVSIHHRRDALQRDSLPTPGRYLSLFNQKKKSISDFISLFDSAEHVNRYTRYSYGKYNCQCRTFQLPGTNTKYPVTVRVDWTEDTDWEYYAKSYGRPKNTYSNRQVIFKTINKLGKVVELSYPLTTFAGAFMEKAIASYFGITKIKCPNELKSLQLADYFTITETNAINGYRLFKRSIGTVLWDYAILDTKTGTTYHASESDQLVSGLRKKLEAKLSHETAIINRKTGYDLGFCDTGMKQFCSDNSIDLDGSYTRSELRNIVIQHRAINHQKYRWELSRVGIHLGK